MANRVGQVLGGILVFLFGAGFCGAGLHNAWLQNHRLTHAHSTTATVLVDEYRSGFGRNRGWHHNFEFSYTQTLPGGSSQLLRSHALYAIENSGLPDTADLPDPPASNQTLLGPFNRGQQIQVAVSDDDPAVAYVHRYNPDGTLVRGLGPYFFAAGGVFFALLSIPIAFQSGISTWNRPPSQPGEWGVPLREQNLSHFPLFQLASIALILLVPNCISLALYLSLPPGTPSAAAIAFFGLWSASSAWFVYIALRRARHTTAFGPLDVRIDRVDRNPGSTFEARVHFHPRVPINSVQLAIYAIKATAYENATHRRRWSQTEALSHPQVLPQEIRITATMTFPETSEVKAFPNWWWFLEVRIKGHGVPPMMRRYGI